MTFWERQRGFEFVLYLKEDCLKAFLKNLVDVETRLSSRILEIALIRPTEIGQYSRL